jgi:hypothetical protein
LGHRGEVTPSCAKAKNYNYTCIPPHAFMAHSGKFTFLFSICAFSSSHENVFCYKFHTK